MLPSLLTFLSFFLDSYGLAVTAAIFGLIGTVTSLIIAILAFIFRKNESGESTTKAVDVPPPAAAAPQAE